MSHRIHKIEHAFDRLDLGACRVGVRRIVHILDFGLGFEARFVGLDGAGKGDTFRRANRLWVDLSCFQANGFLNRLKRKQQGEREQRVDEHRAQPLFPRGIDSAFQCQVTSNHLLGLRIE